MGSPRVVRFGICELIPKANQKKTARLVLPHEVPKNRSEEAVKEAGVCMQRVAISSGGWRGWWRLSFNIHRPKKCAAAALDSLSTRTENLA